MFRYEYGSVSCKIVHRIIYKMYKLSITLFLFFFGILYTQNQATMYYEAIATQEAVESLVEIQHSQALPLVLMIENDSTKLHHPQYLSKAFIDKGRIIAKTQFGRRKSPSKQFYFCPKENSAEKCLVHKEFQPLVPLQCTKEAIPILEVDKKIKCGFKTVGTFYTLFYEICPNQEPYEFKTTELRERIYEFCYDAKKKKIIFITHSILHPKLLSSKELHWERNIQYSIENVDEFTILNQYNLEMGMKTNEPDTEISKYQNKKQKTGKDEYKVQQLVPGEDMAFALWRKYTFRHLNTELQHEKLIALWNEINSHIRHHMGNIFFSKRTEIYTITGVFDLNSKPREDGQISNMWVKLIYFLTYDENNTIPIYSQVTVILMNNFIDTTADYGASSNSQEKTIDHYCDEQDFCAESLKKKFKEVGGQVRCCPLTKKLAELFGYVHIVPISSDIRIFIPGVHEITE